MRQPDPADEKVAHLERQLRLRDDFISIAAHELRNPLTPIALDVDVLLIQARRRGADPAEIASLERLQRNIRVYIRRASTLLDVSRLHSGLFQLDPQRIRLSDVVDRVVAAARRVAEQAHCSLCVTLDDRVVGDWDLQALEQIIENLLSNALRFGAGKPVSIAVIATAVATHLDISDAGTGIAPEHQERIFERFQRAPGASASGFGVGLWVSRQLARAMSGDITVTSVPGRGSTFTLRLPLIAHGHAHVSC